MNRHTIQRQTQLEFGFWLIFGRGGEMRMVRAEPGNLDRSERAMAVSANLPLSLWSTPTIRATVTVPNDSAPASFTLDVEAVSSALKGALGVDLDLVVRAVEQEEGF